MGTVNRILSQADQLKAWLEGVQRVEQVQRSMAATLADHGTRHSVLVGRVHDLEVWRTVGEGELESLRFGRDVARRAIDDIDRALDAQNDLNRAVQIALRGLLRRVLVAHVATCLLGAVVAALLFLVVR